MEKQVVWMCILTIPHEVLLNTMVVHSSYIHIDGLRLARDLILSHSTNRKMAAPYVWLLSVLNWRFKSLGFRPCLCRLFFTLLAMIVLGFSHSTIAYGSDVADEEEDNFVQAVSGRVFSAEEKREVTGIIYSWPIVNGLTPQMPNDDDLRVVREFKKLKFLSLFGDRVTKRGFQELTGISSLEEFQYRQLESADEKLKIITKIPNLRTLVIRDCDATNASAESISTISNLSYLDLTNVKIDSGFFMKHKLPSSVTHLCLTGTNVDSRAIRYLPNGITHLSLTGSKVDESSVPELLKRKNLLRLNVQQLSIDALELLERKLPDTEVNKNAFGVF